MPLTPADVEKLAALARLELSEAEKVMLAGQLGSILEHMDALRAADAEGEEPVDGDERPAAPLRPDAVGFDPLQRPLADIAPAWDDGFFVVPRLAALDPEGRG